jgi:hypothetical protein
VTIKDDLHALIDGLDETDAREALAFLQARTQLDARVSPAYVAGCEAAYDEAFAPDAVRLPHAAVRTWLEAWGTPEQASADRDIEALEERLAKDAHDAAGR